ncbi:MAG: hypothetical protein GXP14_07320 [Gammaproteobacteria bacterium]|nr:hypothetical protein [Gammaproteobacteria bacterium]
MIVATEVGRAFRLSTNDFDMSGNTGLTLNFTSPTGIALQKTELTTNAVSAPAVALVNDPDLGNQAASTYFEFLTVATDFTEAGTWTVCGIYTDGTPKVYHTVADYTFTVLEACS